MKPKRKPKSSRAETAFDRIARTIPRFPLAFERIRELEDEHERQLLLNEARREIAELKAKIHRMETAPLYGEADAADEAIRNYRSTIGILAAELTHANAEIAGLQRGK